MGTLDQIMQLAENNNGTITAAMVAKAGYSRGNLQYLVDKSLLEKAARGVYILPQMWEDEMFNLQMRLKRGVFSLETALFLWDLTDRTPNNYSITFPSSYNVSWAKKQKVRCVQCKDELFELGVDKTITPSGNTVNVYNIERTLCDILKPRNSVDIQIVSDAFKRYATSKNKNIPLLSEYAKKLKVEKRLRSYLEVLL